MAINCWYICTHMSRLIEDIGAFLTSNGFKHSYQMRYGMDVICVTLTNGKSKVIVPLEFSAKTPQEAKDLAEHTELSTSYLSRLFEKELGIAVSDYIREKKIDKAQNLLKYSDFSTVEIANYLSFSSQSHFIQTFEKLVGLTPKKYRDRFYRTSW